MIQFSKALIEKLKKDGAYKTTLDYLRDKVFFKTIILYALNWKYRQTRENLVEWLTKNYRIPNKVVSELSELKNIKDKDSVMRQITRYVRNNIEYLGDMAKWKVGEYWQTPEETWRSKNGDCEDMHILAYCIAHWVGISDDNLYIVCGDCVGGGHCYLVYISEQNNLEYPMDSCYHPDISLKMSIPYIMRKEYYCGQREWWRFNLSGSYKLKG